MITKNGNIPRLCSIISQFKIWQDRRKGVLIESLLFVGLYAVLLFFFSQDAIAVIWIEGLAVMISTFAAAVLIIYSLPSIVTVARHAWFMLAMALLVWTIAALTKLYLNLILGPSQLFNPYLVGINLVGYIIMAYALLRLPTGGHYAAPTRFRFILDVLISSIAVAALAWLMLVPPVSDSISLQLALLLILSAPIADLILLIITTNVLLTNIIPRVSAIYLVAGLMAISLSDYISSSLEILGFIEPGSLISMGWVIGSLLIGIGGVNDKSNLRKGSSLYIRRLETSLSVQFQKVLPIALVLVLFWFILTDFRLGGNLSRMGVWVSLLLGLMLIVRLGIRAGEAELNNYWQLFKNLADPAFICDVTGKIILSNPAFHRLENPGEEYQTLLSVFSDLPDAALKNVSENKFSEALEVRIGQEKKDIPFLLSLNPVVTESRKVLIAGVAHNLSNQILQRNTIQSAYDQLNAVHHQLEELNTGLEDKVAVRTATLKDAYKRLEDQNKVLQELDQLKSDFVSMVSHELRNPLNNLGGGLELLLSRLKNRKSDKNTLELMQAEVIRLTRFVESILDVSALEAGSLKLDLAPLSVDHLIENITQYWSASDKVDRLKIEVKPGLPHVLAAENALESVLLNLIDNAFKYAPNGSVIISAKKQKGKLKIAVRDFGPGIPEEKRSLLFDPFQRLDAKDSQFVYGYGLGLYLSQRMLEQMDSTLTFEAPSDGGARFSFELKVAKNE